MKASITLVALVGLAVVIGCGPSRPPLLNQPGTATKYLDVESPGAVHGIGIESQDVASMTDAMVRDLAACPEISSSVAPARVVIDARYFANESSSRINKNIITNKIRTGLNRAAAGRITFVERERSDMVERERDLKRTGAVDGGSGGSTPAPFGSDYRMAGRITSMDAVHPNTGLQQRTHFIFFSLVDLETGQVVWENEYEFGKASADDIIYR